MRPSRRITAYLIAISSILLLWGVLSSKPLTAADNRKKTRKSKRFSLELTYPVGESPKVFDEGWVFGAECLVRKGAKKQRDISRRVRWSGTGKFSPKRGKQSRPTFKNKSGINRIRLRVKYKGRVRTRIFKVDTVEAASKYAHVGTLAHVPADGHGCSGDPVSATGPILAGSKLVTVNGRPAARQGDPGAHVACCGANTFVVAEGDPEVLIEGKPAARIGDKTQHCGGIGSIVGSEKPTPTPSATPTPTPTPESDFGIYGVIAADTDFLFIGTEDAVKVRKPCSFAGGGLDCTNNVQYSLLAGPFPTRTEAEQAMCDKITDKQYYVLTTCHRRYLYSGKWYWGCEASAHTALFNYCPEKIASSS